jgi:hypothetical protein
MWDAGGRVISIASRHAAATTRLLSTPTTSSPRGVIGLDLGIKLQTATSFQRVIRRIAEPLKLLHGALEFFGAGDRHDVLQF